MTDLVRLDRSRLFMVVEPAETKTVWTPKTISVLRKFTIKSDGNGDMVFADLTSETKYDGTEAAQVKTQGGKPCIG